MISILSLAVAIIILGKLFTMSTASDRLAASTTALIAAAEALTATNTQLRTDLAAAKAAAEDPTEEPGLNSLADQVDAATQNLTTAAEAPPPQ